MELGKSEPKEEKNPQSKMDAKIKRSKSVNIKFYEYKIHY